MTHTLMPLMIAVPLGGAFLCALMGKRARALPDAMGFLVTLLAAAGAVYSVSLVKSAGPLVYSMGGWRAPVGIVLSLDGLTSLMLVTVNLVAFLVAVYARGYMERYTSKRLFYGLFLLMLAGMNGVVLTGDMFNLFVFLEIASVASYALVAFGTGKHELEAAFKYGVMGTIASLFILLGIILLYARTSTLNMADMAAQLADGGGDVVPLVTGLFLAGFGLKAALVPFHAWLPDAHPSAPAPISAMLSGVLIKSLGVYALVRVLYNVLGVAKVTEDGSPFTPLIVLGILSMMVGVVLALGQWDMKRLLAYHSISQIGYVILAIGIGTPLAVMAGLFHLFNHSIFKSLLFLDSGALEHATGTRDLRRMAGVGRKLPVTSSTTLIASMSIAGIPPFNGFWSKLLIIVAAVQAGHSWSAFWAVLASILTLASFTKVLRYGFQGGASERLRQLAAVPLSMKVALVLFAVICIGGGLLLLPSLRDLFLGPAADALAGGTEQLGFVLTGGAS
ncbi:MAG: monovalent cation/H+ antiporter subunit D family protein [Candidatus Fermentibacteraceae bacterium]